jgi:hypothetical protein
MAALSVWGHHWGHQEIRVLQLLKQTLILAITILHFQDEGRIQNAGGKQWRCRDARPARRIEEGPGRELPGVSPVTNGDEHAGIGAGFLSQPD